MGLFDAHAHCDDRRIEEEYPGGTLGLISDCLANGVSYLVNIGTNLQNSKKSIELARQFENVYATVGFHPYDITFIENEQDAINELKTLLKEDKVVALGEIGLDYHYEPYDKALQLHYFRVQMALAEEYRLPVVIHSRDAMMDTLSVLKEFPNVKGVFHSFCGSKEIAKELIKMGWYLSFSGPVTYKNAVHPKESCVVVPSDRILMETDSPYLPPTPLRGTMNTPLNLHYIAREIASLRGEDYDSFVLQTEENARRFFGIK